MCHVNIGRIAKDPIGSLSRGSRDLAKFATAPGAEALRTLEHANIIDPKTAGMSRDVLTGTTNIGTDLLTGATAARALGSDPKTLYRNPSAITVPEQYRGTAAYRNVTRPAAKIGSALALGYLTGGLSGAAAAGLGSAATGGASSTPYQPVHDVVIPAATGYLAGSSEAGQAFNANPSFGTGADLLLSGAGIGGGGLGGLMNMFGPQAQQQQQQMQYGGGITGGVAPMGNMPSGGANQQGGQQQMAGGSGIQGNIFGVNPNVQRDVVVQQNRQ